MKIGDIVLHRGKYREIIDVLPNSVVLETGTDTLIVNKDNVTPAFKVWDRVYIKDTNKSFNITGFYFKSSLNDWVAERDVRTSTNFHADDHKQWFLLNTLEFPIKTSL